MDPVTLALAKGYADGQFGGLLPLTPHVDTLLDSRIVDHNLDVASPPNGHYVRWESGLQVCWHQITLGWGEPNELDGWWTFPATFSIVPRPRTFGMYINEGSSITPGATELGLAEARTISGIQARFLQWRVKDMTPFTNGDVIQMDVFAIGRWR